jgi:hypothetical protein
MAQNQKWEEYVDRLVPHYITCPFLNARIILGFTTLTDTLMTTTNIGMS